MKKSFLILSVMIQLLFAHLLFCSTPFEGELSTGGGVDIQAIMQDAEVELHGALRPFLESHFGHDLDTVESLLGSAKATLDSEILPECSDFFYSVDRPLCICNHAAHVCELLSWCECYHASLDLRKTYTEGLLADYAMMSLFGQVKQEDQVCHVEFGSGFLKQVFLLARGLMACGFKDLLCIGIDPIYADSAQKRYFERVFEYLFQGKISKCRLQLYASVDEFNENFLVDFPSCPGVTSLASIDLPSKEAYQDFMNCLSLPCLTECGSVKLAFNNRVVSNKAEIIKFAKIPSVVAQ